MQVILPDSSTPGEEVAFDDLVALLSRATGRPVAEHRGRLHPGGGPAFLVGRLEHSPALRALEDPDLVSLYSAGRSEILVKTLPENQPPVIVATGVSARAAADAVYCLLEDVLGFGFFPEQEQVPDLSAWQPHPLRVQARPTFEERLYATNAFWAAPWRYCSRLWDESEWESLIVWLRRKRFTGLVCYNDEGGHLWGRAFFDAFPEVPRKGALRGYVMDPDRRTELNHSIFRLARANGLNVAYKLMYSVLPDLIADAHPELLLHPQPTDSVAVCAATPECPDMMRRFWSRILQLHPPEERQLYIVCPYHHRAPVCEHVRSRSLPALDAVGLLRDMDPDARIYLETPCGLDPEANAREWSDYRSQIPGDVGVVDWASGLEEPGPRPDQVGCGPSWLTTIHLSRPGLYPPVSASITPERMQAEWSEVTRLGAAGVIVTNLIANSSTYLCDYAAGLNWNAGLRPDTHLLAYGRRRYGARAAEGMARAYAHMAHCLVPELTLPGASLSLERQLVDLAADGGVTREWLAEQIADVSGWLEAACSARAIALEALEDDEATIPERFMRESAYAEWRCLTILALLRAHKSVSPVEAAELVVEAVDHLRALAARYRYPDLCMEGIRQLAKERGVVYTPWFYENWRLVGERKGDAEQRAWLFPTYEYFPEYERAVLAAAPEHVREAALNLLNARDHALESEG